jgi:hypothetical protein
MLESDLHREAAGLRLSDSELRAFGDALFFLRVCNNARLSNPDGPAEVYCNMKVADCRLHEEQLASLAGMTDERAVREHVRDFMVAHRVHPECRFPRSRPPYPGATHSPVQCVAEWYMDEICEVLGIPEVPCHFD